jgi:ferredoxin-nitrite reductase
MQIAAMQQSRQRRYPAAMPQDPGFTDDQKQYLEGFIAGIATKRAMAAPNLAATSMPPPSAETTAPHPCDPTAIHLAAQHRAVAAGGTLVPEELAKRDKNPFDIWDDMAANAAAGKFPKGLDVFRHKFHGLFYVAPNQDAYMLRLRLPGGIVSAYQARGIADIAERFGGRQCGRHHAGQFADPRDRRRPSDRCPDRDR